MAAALGLVLAACTSSSGSTGGDAPAPGAPSWLFTLRAEGATTVATPGGATLHLEGLDPTVVAFTDRPDRLAGTEDVAAFQRRWDERFAGDPPNAALVDEAGTAVVAIEAFRLVGAGAELEVVVLEDVGGTLGALATDDPLDPAELAAGLLGVTLFVDGAATGPGDPEAPAGPDPSSTTPHLDAVVAKLRATNPTSEGIAWSRTSGNALGQLGQPADAWLLQTPQCWGRTTCDTAAFDRFTSTLRDLTAGATTVVDLTTLYPYPDGDFRQALVDGLGATFAAGNRPLIRVTAGVPPTYSIGGTSAAAWRDAFAADVAAKAGTTAAQVPLAVASVATSWGWSWNHAKIVAVDGRAAVIGGHNLWSADYLQTTNPINDVSVVHRGPVVADAHTLVDDEWGFICANTGLSGRLNVDYKATAAVTRCPSVRPSLPAAPEAVGGVEALSISRLGMGIKIAQVRSGPLPTDLASRADARAAACSLVTDDYTNRDAPYERDNPGEPALRALIASATTSVVITQQDMIGMCSAYVTPKWDVRVFDALADRVAAGVEVRIVISTPGTEGYTNDGTLADVSAYLLSRIQAKVGDAGRAKQLLCAQVGVAPLRFNDTADSWPGGQGIGNHTKVVAVDRAAFYVGSQNLYPAWLQEHGVIVEDAVAAETFHAELLDPMWRYSQRAADTSQCG